MTCKSGKRYVLAGIILAALLCLAVIPAVSAIPLPPFTATLTSPANTGVTLYNGNTINVQIGSLAVGHQLTYRVYSSDLTVTGNSVTFNGMVIPFSFADGSVTTNLVTSGISSPTLDVKRISDSTEVTVPGTNVSHFNVKKDTYNIVIAGTPTGSTASVDYSVTGTISDTGGAGPVTLSLPISNINAGHLTVEVDNGATQLLSDTFTISTPPGPRPPGPSGGGGGNTGGGGGANGGLLAPQQQSLLAPPEGVSATTVTVQTDAGGKALNDYTVQTDPAAGFSSSVAITQGTTLLTSTGQPINSVSVTPLDPKSVPTPTNTQGGVFSFSGLSVECSPSGAQFTGGSVTISFSLTPAQWADALTKVNGDTSAMTIQYYDTTTNAWDSITTTVDPNTHTVTAQVSHFSTYALFYKLTSESTSAPSAQTTPNQTSTTPATTGVTSAAVATPVHTLNAPPAPSTTQSPGLPGIVVIGVIGIVGYCISRKKQ